jgi:hypothetical protein
MSAKMTNGPEPEMQLGTATLTYNVRPRYPASIAYAIRSP